MVRYGFVLSLVLTLGGLTRPVAAQTPVFKIEDNTGTTLLLVNDDGTITLPTGATNGFVLTTDANGNATWMPASGGGSLTLPFAGTHSTAGDAFSITVDNTAAGSAGVFENTNGGNGEAPLVARTNSIVGTALLVEATGGVAAAWRAVSSGTAARFEGDVEITDDVEVTGALVCTGCVEGTDVDPLGGIYAGKSALYINDNSGSVPVGACAVVTATCNDANDMPLQGICKPPLFTNTVVRWRDALDWDSATNPAAFSCEMCNNAPGPETMRSEIVCIDVN